jgi:hypothetical protein
MRKRELPHQIMFQRCAGWIFSVALVSEVDRPTIRISYEEFRQYFPDVHPRTSLGCTDASEELVERLGFSVHKELLA